MSQSKRSHEGYLLIDNRSSEGVSDELLRSGGAELPAGAGRGMFEAAVIICSHCQAGVVLNPLRNRERAYCAKCDHYLCDRCGAIAAQTRECRTFKQLIEEVQEKAALDEQRGIIVP